MPEGVYLVVVSVIEGKNFQTRTGYHLVAECAFDGELLMTDPVDHADAPKFSTELAWQLNKKVLHQHRMQRTPIKLQCFAINTINGQREQIGYALLDLRLAQLTPQEPKWYNLLNRKYPKQKSAIKVGISLEQDSLRQDDSSVLDQQRTSKQFTVKIDEKARYFQIGSSDEHHDMFILSVTIKFAVNLEQLVPVDRRLTSGNSGYFFRYTLLGNDIIEEPFSDLLNPELVPKRTSLRIRTSHGMLKQFLTCGPGLQIHLCSSDHSLGKANIPLKTIFEGQSGSISSKPLEVEDAFILSPPHSTDNELESAKAKIGVFVSLGQEVMPEDSGDWLAMARETIPGKSSNAATCKDNISDDTQPHDELHESDVMAASLHSISLEETAPSVTCNIRHSKVTALTTSYETNTLKESVATNSASANLTTSGTRLAIPPQARHYQFSLHLQSVENYDLPNLSSAYLKYLYPFFGSAAPIIINIAAGISKGIDFKLSSSLCNFDFACTPSLLQNTFVRVPLDIELWSRNSESDDILIATAVLPLELLLAQKPVRYLISCDIGQKTREGIKLSLQTKLEMKMVHEPLSKVGRLQVFACLEDMGSVLKRKMLTTE